MSGGRIDGLAVVYEPTAYSLRQRVMGRQSAGLGFLRALAAKQPARLWCYAGSRAAMADFEQVLGDLGSRAEIVHVPILEPRRLRDAGLLYRPDPAVDQEAWHRLAHGSSRAFSICGITHTTASHAVMTAIASLPLAPLEDWDALICTSLAVRDSVRHLIENQVEYLRERLGATRLALPQMPIIPLGVHWDDFQFGDGEKRAARSELGIAEDEIVVLFVGRLSFHAKSHPAPLYAALQRAAVPGRKIVLLQAGWYANAEVEKAFLEDAHALCPGVRYVHVDGCDQDKLRAAWAAGDIFTSLSDNIQETFGLTPVEAMAAGLPVVVTDWNGYRDTVRHEIDGFRISTISLSCEERVRFSDRYDMRIDSYDAYCGFTSQYVAVNLREAVLAFEALISNPGLRQRMGEAGRARAREFDWSVIMERYIALWSDLSERRRSNPDLHRPLASRRRPDRPDSFALFASYPTQTVDESAEFRRLASEVSEVESQLKLMTVKYARLIQPDIKQLLCVFNLVSDDWQSAGSMFKPGPPHGHWSALVFLCKLGAVDFRASSENRKAAERGGSPAGSRRDAGAHLS